VLGVQGFIYRVLFIDKQRTRGWCRPHFCVLRVSEC
jgi:hypothetical protein